MSDRNTRVARLLAYIDQHTGPGDHGYRAKVRVASLHPPTGPFPTVEAVDQAIADTAPAEEPTA